MIKPILLLITLTLFHFSQDVKVATWSTGQPDTDQYESLAFWIKENKRAYIRYTHGKDADDVELTWLGPDQEGDVKGLRVGFPAPDTLSLSIIPSGYNLKVHDRRGSYQKEFHWENENKSGDSTAVCSICAQDEREAMRWLYTYFLK